MRRTSSRPVAYLSENPTILTAHKQEKQEGVTVAQGGAGILCGTDYAVSNDRYGYVNLTPARVLATVERHSEAPGRSPFRRFPMSWCCPLWRRSALNRCNCLRGLTWMLFHPRRLASAVRTSTSTPLFCSTATRVALTMSSRSSFSQGPRMFGMTGTRARTVMKCPPMKATAM